LPDDLILSLKQAEQPREYLGPPSKKTLNGIKPSVPVRKNYLGHRVSRNKLFKLFLKFNIPQSIVRKPDNAWNHEKQREKFKFLTDQPVCSCGAGK
jgi:hypothetical protein